MSEKVTLTQLAAEMSHLRQQLATINQRLDMIYGAVTRLANQNAPAQPPSPPHSASTPQSSPELPVSAMMDPDSMLDSLHQYAVKLGLDVSKESVERLKTETQNKSPVDKE